MSEDKPTALGEVVDITMAASLKETLFDALAAEEPVVIDGSAVERADAAGIQLLVAFARAAAGGPGWQWTAEGPSAALEGAAARLGLDGELAGPTA